MDIHTCSETFFLDGAGCQLIKLTTDQSRLECFCVEHEDPALVLQVLHRPGLQAQANISYPQGLKAAFNLPLQH